MACHSPPHLVVVVKLLLFTYLPPIARKESSSSMLPVVNKVETVLLVCLASRISG